MALYWALGGKGIISAFPILRFFFRLGHCILPTKRSMKASCNAMYIESRHQFFEENKSRSCKPLLPLSDVEHAHLLPDIREQIVASATESCCRFTLCSASGRGSISSSRGGCSTAPATKVIVLCYLRCAPARRCCRSGRSSCRLTWGSRSPDVVATPCVHVGKARVVYCWRGRCSLGSRGR